MSREKDIFKRASSTFFFSSLFFPPKVKKDVFDLYSFVRAADDYVDQRPADNDSFYYLRRLWNEAAADPNFDVAKNPADTADERAVKNMMRISRNNNFDMAWVESFLNAMQADLAHKHYETIDATLEYLSGSAEVIGFMMAKIMELKPEAFEAAKLQGRAFQYINFIRDIEEDNNLGRQYFPGDELKKYGLTDLSRESALKQPAEFAEFIHFQLDRYEAWQLEAYAGYKYIPKRLRIPLQTAAGLYDWTAAEIRQNPLVVYQKKVKPTRVKYLSTLLTKMR